MIRTATALLVRDLRLAGRIGGSGALALVFFLMVVVLIPFALGPDLALLSRIGPAILWIAAALATLIGLDRLFGSDEEDGTLDLLRLSPAPLEVLVLAKVAAHWLLTGLPLALASPLLALLLAMPPDAIAASFVALLLGTPALTFTGAIGAALTATIRRGGVILAVLVLPFCVPILVFGVAASDPASEAAGPARLVLLALSLGAGAIGTLASAAALRASD